MKDFIKIIKELKKSSKGKAVLFFGFYLIFFLIIAILARLFPGNVQVNDVEEEKEDVISISEVNGYNYKYNYSITIDNNTYIINGKKNGENEEFTFNLNNVNYDYYKNGTLYYSNGIIVDSPSPYLEIVHNIDLLLEKATYDSVVNYKSGKNIFRYLISSSTISNIIDNKDLDIEEVPNEIRLSKSSENIEEVEIDLNSYCKALNICINNMSIKMIYSDFNNVGEITNQN